MKSPSSPKEGKHAVQANARVDARQSSSGDQQLHSPNEETAKDRREVFSQAWASLGPLKIKLSPPKYCQALEIAVCLAVMNEHRDQRLTYEEFDRKLHLEPSALRAFLSSDSIGQNYGEEIKWLTGSAATDGLSEQRFTNDRYFFATYLPRKSLIKKVLDDAADEVFSASAKDDTMRLVSHRQEHYACLEYTNKAKAEAKKPAKVDPVQPVSQPISFPAADSILAAVKTALGPVRLATSRNEDMKQSVASACKRFCDVFNPGCDIGFYFDHWLKRTECLYTRRLYFEWPIHGGWQQDLPTWIIVDRQPCLVYLPFPTRFGSQEPAHQQAPFAPFREGGFQHREDIDPLRVICVRLEWGSSVVVLLLNWRKDNSEPSTNDLNAERAARARLQPLWRAIDSRHQWANATEEFEQALRPFEEAVMFFSGWLSAARLQLPERQANVINHPAASLCLSACSAAWTPDKRNSGGILAQAISDALNLAEEKAFCRVHWVDPKSRELVLDDKEKFNLPPKHPDGRFPLKLTAGQKVPRFSTSVAAAMWKSGLHLDFSDTRPLPGTQPPLTWSDISVKRKDIEHNHEIVVPIFDGTGEPLAVANVATEQERPKEDVSRTELVTYLFQKLWAVFHSNVTQDGRQRQKIKRLLSDEYGPKTFHAVCKDFCGWVSKQLGADLARLLIFNARVGAFLPYGVELSEDSAKDFVKKETGHPALGLTETERNKLRSDYESSDEGRKGGIHALLEYVIAWRLLPRPEGNTRKIFANTVTHAFVRDTTVAPNVDEVAKRYFESILGLPFRHGGNAQPDGVLWISWMNQPKGHPALKSFWPDDEKFVAGVQSLIETVTEVVAGVLNVYRCCDPKGTAEPLPQILPPKGEETPSSESHSA